MSLLFIGEMPSKPTGSALAGRIGERLAKLCSTTAEDLDRRVDRHNLIPEVLANWDYSRARRNAAFLMYQLGTYDVVVICGRRVASAFGLNRVPFLTPHRLAQTGDQAPYTPTFLVMPHPSGVNRWYNQPENTVRAQQVLTELYRKYGEVDVLQASAG